MSFADELGTLPLARLAEQARASTPAAVRESLARPKLALADFARLLSPAAGELLELLGRRAHALTQQRFGKVIRLFAPLYLSNECVNDCRYCGFSRDNPILRVTLSVEEVLREARALKQQGFRNLLLVAGEHPKFISVEYLAECVRAVHAEVPSLSLEIATLATADYRRLAQAGAEGLVVYQETYDRDLYARLHPSGPKRDFDWRLAAPERAFAGGFRRLGIGALLGLGDWRADALALAAHAAWLWRHCWKAQLTISVPRHRPCAGDFAPPCPVSDRELVQLVCALRLFLPDAGLVLSTREPPRLRDGLVPLGITLMSAGSHTEPGGYTGAGQERLHQSRAGHSGGPAPGAGAETAPGASPDGATVQFQIADHRSAMEVSNLIRRLGYEPVWKDWDAALTA